MIIDKRSFLCAAAALTLLAAPSAWAEDAMVLKSADVHPLGYPTVQAVENMGKKLEEATGGRLSDRRCTRPCSSAARRRRLSRCRSARSR